MKALVLILFLASSATTFAATGEFPVNEQEFVERIKSADPAEIVALLGEPDRKIDVTDDKTGQVFGSIWHYRYLNTGENGDYYPTTELDFVGDRVVTVVFSAIEEPDPTRQADPAVECAQSC